MLLDSSAIVFRLFAKSSAKEALSNINIAFESFL